MTVDSLQLVKLWVDIVQFVSITVIAIAGWVLARVKVNKASIDKLADRHAALKEHVDRCEAELLHLPGHDDLGALHEKINRVDSALQGLRGEMTGINATLKLIHQAMLEDRKPNK